MSKSVLLLLLGLSSCAYFIERIDTPLVRNSDAIRRPPETPGHCALDGKGDFLLTGTNDKAQVVYTEFTKALGQRLDFLDHFALWNLFQLSIRPDQSSPTSRLQVLLSKDGSSHYFDFFSEAPEEQYPYLYGIEWVLKKFGKKTSLEYYAGLIMGHLGTRLKIGKDFELFLTTNLPAIKADPAVSAFYLRGADVLKEGETSPFLDYRAVIGHYRKAQRDQKIIVNTALTPFVMERGLGGSCNYDFNLYDNSIFLIDKIVPVANLYGLATLSGAFLASSSQRLDQVTGLKGLPLFKGLSKVRSSAVCMIENNGNKIWAISNQSRDPGQHLFHLVRYGLPGSRSVSDVDKLIRHSRHLFLSDPLRLIIESARSSEEQIENLLKLNLPIYNAERLGNIWAYTQFPEGQRFIIDRRNPGALLCR